MTTIGSISGVRPTRWAALGYYLQTREHEGGVWGLFAALHRSFKRILLGLLLGSACLLVVQLLEHRSFGDMMVLGLDHLGMALFVAAIAVFGYEWQSHYKQLFDKLIELKTMLGDLKDIVRGQAHVGIDAGLRALFPDETHELNRQIRTSLKSIVTTVDVSETEHQWNRDVYIALVTGALTSVADFSRIGVELGKATSVCTLRIPSAAELADFMLAAQMSCMQAGDEYKVVSDFSSWATGLSHFMEATERGAARGVVVTRIFYPFPYDASVGVDGAIDVLEKHRALAKRYPGAYRVAITTASSVVATHEGIFVHGNSVLKFRPLDRELRRIEFLQQQKDTISTESVEKVWDARLLDSDSSSTFDSHDLRRELERIWRVSAAQHGRR